MKYLIPLLALLILPSCIFGKKNPKQSEEVIVEDFLSENEMDRYYQERRNLFSIHNLPSREDVLQFSSPYCEIREIETYSPYVDSTIWRTPYIDSIRTAISANGDYSDKKIAGVYKYSIIKHEKKGAFEAFIYTDYKYCDGSFDGPDLWIALSQDKGKTWKHYFTGLYHEQPIRLKWYSRLPLIVDENTLQIEAALVTAKREHSQSPKEYKLFKDGIVVTFYMDVIAKDSDGDGLTDIVEAKFRTDPYNKDTNGNGIPDNLDLNPRHNVQRTNLTIVFETIIDNRFGPNDIAGMNHWERWFNIPPYISFRADEALSTTGNHTGAGYANEETQTILIVTGDPSIKAMQPKYVRAIIISSEEYKKSENNKFISELIDFSISPMFKVDGEEEKFIIDYSCSWVENFSYHVRKTKNGWQIKPIKMQLRD